MLRAHSFLPSVLADTLLPILFLTGMAMTPCHTQAQAQSPQAEQSPAKTPVLKYSAEPATLYYQLHVTADFGERHKLDTTATLVYQIKTVDAQPKTQTQPQQLELRHRLVPKRSRSGYSNNETGFYKLPTQLMTSGSNIPAIIALNGKAADVQHPSWLLGLPLDISHLAFPLLQDKETWSAEEPVSLVSAAYGKLQLHPISPQIKNRYSSNRYARSEKRPSVVTIAHTTSKITKHDDNQITMTEKLTLDGSTFSPQVSVSGSGTTVFSVAKGSVESIQQIYTVTWKEPNREMIVPIHVNLIRAPQADIDAYEAEVKQRADRMAELKKQREETQGQVPELTDREAVMQIAKTGSKELFDALISKVDRAKLSDDPEMATIFYGQFFKRESTPYQTKSVIARLDPTLEKTTVLADKYARHYSSFDITLTGDPIPSDAKLTKGQIVCYRETGSSFHAGIVYGPVEDILVIRTRNSPPKLLAIPRKNCRFPSRDFIDPALPKDK